MGNPNLALCADFTSQADEKAREEVAEHVAEKAGEVALGVPACVDPEQPTEGQES